MFWCALPSMSEDRQKSGNGALGTLEFGSLQMLEAGRLTVVTGMNLLDNTHLQKCLISLFFSLTFLCLKL